MRMIGFALAGSLAFTAAAGAQGVMGNKGGSAPDAIAAPEETFGTATTTAVVVGAYECDPFDPAAPINNDGGPNRYTAGFMECPVMMPSGATIVSIELEAC